MEASAKWTTQRPYRLDLVTFFGSEASGDAAGRYSFFFRAAAFRRAGFSGAGVVECVSTTRGDTKVRAPWASNSMTVWY